MAAKNPTWALSRNPQVLTMARSDPWVLARKLITLGAQARDDALAVN